LEGAGWSRRMGDGGYKKGVKAEGKTENIEISQERKCLGSFGQENKPV